MSNSTEETFITTSGEVMFAVLQEQYANNFKNKMISRAQGAKKIAAAKEAALFSIRVKLDSSDPAIKHLLSVNEAKIKTKTNAVLHATDKSKTVVNFSSNRIPTIVGTDSTVLTGENIPVFNSSLGDTATALVTYQVVTYDNGTQIVRLSGVKFTSLTQTEREAFTGGVSAPTEEEINVTRDMLNSGKA